MRILGIDPGTGIMGFSVLEIDRNNKIKPIDIGVISTPPKTKLKSRLLDIHNSLTDIIKVNRPDVVSIEKLFFARNITTAVSVAEARGVAILTAAQFNLPIFEYTPLQIKQTLTGYGRADKKQIQEMVRIHLGMQNIIKPDDAADACATAITHHLMTKNGLSSETDLQL